MQEEKIVFKVWNSSRIKKAAFVLSAREKNMYETLVLKANQKLELDGVQLVLENDGTVVDEDEVLQMVSKDTLMLLQKEEIWTPPGCNTITFIDNNFDNTSSSASLPSTVTLQGSLEGSCSSLGSLNDITIDGPQNEGCGGTAVTGIFAPLEEVSQLPTEKQCHISASPETSVRQNESMWREFAIPWVKLSSNDMEQLQNGNIDKALKKKVIHMVVDEMREYSTSIANKSFRIVANKIVDKYPMSFKDIDDDGIVLGDGSTTIYLKLHERNNYLNTIMKKKKRLFEGDSSDECESDKNKKKQRKLLAAKAGCLDWEPTLLKNAEADSLEQKTDFLRNNTFSNEDANKLYSLLDSTYAIQRQFLNTIPPPSIKDIQEKWPILLSKEGLYWHFKKLMNKNLSELGENLLKKADKLFLYGKKLKIKQAPNLTELHEDKKALETVKTMALLLKENIEDILFTVEDVNDLELLPTSSPCIVTSENGDTKKFYVAIEKAVINNGSDSFMETLETLYGTYYNFNMQYPKKFSSTLEFIQRYLMKCHPDIGTKSQLFSSSKKKVISLLKSIAEFELKQ